MKLSSAYMRTGNFTNQLTGPSSYLAFVPNHLPFEINYSKELQNLLSQADIALGRLDGITESLPQDVVDFFILMNTRKEATLSSRIEGTQATFIDVVKAEAKIIDNEIHKDVDEVLNYISALNFGIKRLSDLPLSLRLIKEIHEKLLNGVRGHHKNPGEFRTSQNWIGGTSINSAKFVPPPHTEVVNLMGNLEKFIHNKNDLPTLIKAGILHAQFETIHPFLDGNGRIGRLLVIFFLCHENVISKQMLYLSDYFNENRAEYYDRLNEFRTKDKIEEWLIFFLSGIIYSCNSTIDLAKKIRQLKDDNLSIIATFGLRAKNALKLVNYMYKSPVVTLKKVQEVTNISSSNVISLVDKFVQCNLLVEITGNPRYKVYIFKRYLNLFNV